MQLPSLVKQLVEIKLAKLAEKRIPARFRGEIRLEHSIRGLAVTLVETRPHWQDKSRRVENSIARFRYDPTGSKWTLYWRDRSAKWHEYTQFAPKKSFDAVLAEIDADPTGIFWG